MTSSVLVYILVLTGKITPDEADVLQKQMSGEAIPNNWRDFEKYLDTKIEGIRKQP